MKTRSLKLNAGLTALGVLYAAEGLAQDRCELFENKDLAGTARTMTLPATTVSLATGSPAVNAWGATSARQHAGDLGAFNNKATSARIRAVDSDVALYFLDGGDFNGKGEAFHCKKGRTCTINLGGGMNDKTSSAICQREFFRKAKVSDPNAHPWIVAAAALENPIIDLKLVSDFVDAQAKTMIEAQDSVSEYRPESSEDGYSLWSRTSWISEYEYCKRLNLACKSSANTKFRDMFQISKRFEIEIEGEPIIADDDYVVEANWYVRPVIHDHDANPATVEQLLFWWGSTRWWIEEGMAHDNVADQVVPQIESINIQQELRTGIELLAFAGGVPGVYDDKHRLQFSIYSDANVGKTTWSEAFDMTTTHPKVVLNKSREADYL